MVFPIIEYSHNFDYQKLANNTNVGWGIPVAPNNSLLTFSFKVENGLPLTSFQLRKVKVFGFEIIELATYELIAIQKPVETTSGDFRIYTQDAKYLPSNRESGLYYFYFTDGNFEKKSELFCIDDDIVADYPVFMVDDGTGNPTPFKISDNLGNADNFYIKG